MMPKAIILGYSGHAYVVIDTVLADYEILGYCEFEPSALNPYQLPYLGLESKPEVLEILKQQVVFLGIGDNRLRSKVYKLMVNQQINCPSIVDCTAKVSPMVRIGFGTTIMPGAIVNSCATLGEAVICNSGCIIEHECNIENFAHIAPGAVLAGNVTVGKYSFIGANAVVKQGVKIGQNVIVGAGSVVLQDIPDDVTAYGNPAKFRLR